MRPETLRRTALVAALTFLVPRPLGATMTPQITSVTPSSGRNDAAQPVTIQGFGFEAGARVSLLGREPYLAASLDLPSTARRVAVSGTHAYVADTGDFKVVDVSDPTHPLVVGTHDEAGLVYYNVAVEDGYAFVGTATTLLVLDVRDPARPAKVGQLFTGGGRLAVSGGYVYLAAGNPGLQVVDVRNPAAPVVVGNYDPSDSANGVAVSGGYAYLAVNEQGLQVIDISDPEHPTLAGSCDTPGTATHVAVSGTTAYVADSNWGVAVVDVGNPGAPFFLASQATVRSPEDLAVAGRKLYAAVGAGGLEVINVRDPADPSSMGSINLPNNATGLAILGDFAILAATDLAVVDLRHPVVPVPVGGCETPGYAHRAVLSGSHLYVADWDMGLMVMDLTDPTRPTLAGFYDTAAGAMDVALAGSHAYVADGEAGLQVIDVSNPAAPVWRGRYNTPGVSLQVAAGGGYAYLADGPSGLQVIDVSNPAAPAKVATYPVNQEVNDVALVGNLVFLAVGGYDQGGLEVVNVSNPAAPFRVGSYFQGGYTEALSVAVSGSHAYLGVDQNTYGPASDMALWVVDVGNPAAPSLVATHTLPEWNRMLDSPRENDVSVAGDHVYVAAGLDGFLVFDVATPSRPVWVGLYDTPGSAHGLAVSGDLAYVADGTPGLTVLRLNDPDIPVTVSGPNTIQATLPTGLGEGTYDVQVANPSSMGALRGVLVSGYRVIEGIPPVAVSNLAAGEVTGSTVDLSWLAPGDDGNVGWADSYDLRLATAPLTEGNWDAAAPLEGEPEPRKAGLLQTVTVAGLTSDTTYWFALKSRDDAGNVSPLSNVASATTWDVTPPAPVADLLADGVGATSVDLSWTAPGDDGPSGTASVYDLRFTTGALTTETWADAVRAEGEPSPAAAGTLEEVTLAGLLPLTTYRIGLKVRDEAGNASPLSNVVEVTTPGLPDIKLVPAALNFRTVALGKMKKLAFQIKNLGGADLSVSRIRLAGKYFALVTPPKTPFSVVPGGAVKVWVKFAPRAKGNRTGTVTVGSDDPDTPAAKVTLKGSGT
jgi:chitodextrinase